MPDLREQAAMAQDLIDNGFFAGIVEGIRARQVAVFLDPSTTTDERENAHVLARALLGLEAEIVSKVHEFKME